MRPESKKFLYDVQQAANKVAEFCAGRGFSDYSADPMLRSAVERQFEVIGEALRQLSLEDPTTASRVTDHQQIISFRNILIHGYAQVDDSIVWDIVKTKLPVLTTEVRALLDDA